MTQELSLESALKHQGTVQWPPGLALGGLVVLTSEGWPLLSHAWSWPLALLLLWLVLVLEARAHLTHRRKPCLVPLMLLNLPREALPPPPPTPGEGGIGRRLSPYYSRYLHLQHAYHKDVSAWQRLLCCDAVGLRQSDSWQCVVVRWCWVWE